MAGRGRSGRVAWLLAAGVAVVSVQACGREPEARVASPTSASALPSTPVPSSTTPSRLVVATSQTLSPTRSSVLASLVVEVDPAVLVHEGAPRVGPFVVSVSPSVDVELLCTLTLDPGDSGVRSWSGHDDGRPTRAVTVAVTGDAVAIRISGTDRSWEVLPTTDGRYRADEIDPSVFGED